MARKKTLLEKVFGWLSDAPNKLRLMTRRELKRFGFASSTKKYVLKDIKRITKRTQTVTHRQVRKATTGQTVEQHARANAPRRRAERITREKANIRKVNLAKIRKAGHVWVKAKILVSFSTSETKLFDLDWQSLSASEVEDLYEAGEDDEIIDIAFSNYMGESRNRKYSGDANIDEYGDLEMRFSR